MSSVIHSGLIAKPQCTGVLIVVQCLKTMRCCRTPDIKKKLKNKKRIPSSAVHYTPGMQNMTYATYYYLRMLITAIYPSTFASE